MTKQLTDWETEQIALTAENLKLATALAAVLNERPENDKHKAVAGEYQAYSFKIDFEGGIKGNGYTVFFNTRSYREEDKFKISGIWPMDSHNHMYIPDQASRPEIGVSKSKSLEKIAKDVLTRFLPEYRSLVVGMRLWRDKEENAMNGREQTVTKICGEFLGREPRETELGNGEIHCLENGLDMVRVNYNGTKIELTADGLTVENAFKVMALLKTFESK